MLCRGRNTGALYASITLALMDSNYQPLERQEIPVNSSAWSDHLSTLTAPASARYGAVVAYSENLSLFDNCIVTTQ